MISTVVCPGGFIDQLLLKWISLQKKRPGCLIFWRNKESKFFFDTLQWKKKMIKFFFLNYKHWQMLLVFSKKNKTAGEVSCWRPAPHLLLVFSNEFVVLVNDGNSIRRTAFYRKTYRRFLHNYHLTLFPITCVKKISLRFYRLYNFRSFRSSHWRCSVRKGVLRNFAKFTEKGLWQSLFYNKVTG